MSNKRILKAGAGIIGAALVFGGVAALGYEFVPQISLAREIANIVPKSVVDILASGAFAAVFFFFLEKSTDRESPETAPRRRDKVEYKLERAPSTKRRPASPFMYALLAISIVVGVLIIPICIIIWTEDSITVSEGAKRVALIPDPAGRRTR